MSKDLVVNSNSHKTTPVRLVTGLALALFYSGLLLVVSVVSLMENLEYFLTRQRFSEWVAESPILGTPVATDVAWFVAGQVLLHSVFAVVIWLAAVLIGKAYPSVAHRRNVTVTACALVGVFWVMVANAAQFPWSIPGGAFQFLVIDTVGGVDSVALFSAALAVICVYSLIRVLLAKRAEGLKISARVIVYPLLIVGGVALLSNMPKATSGVVDTSEPPHIIIIGIDSLRTDVIDSKNAASLTPNIDRYLSEAFLFEDAITPLARTFPAWVAILTGKAPPTTGVRENLMARSLIRVNPTLGDRLRPKGYETIYATDEVRFSNIDETFGFDKIIGPRMGAGDFLLSSINDLPLSNLIANSWLGSKLFPYTYANRAAAVTYKPSTFLDLLDARLELKRPTLLAVHLTLPHWPFYWADDEVFENATDRRYQYLAGVVAADRQFRGLMSLLEDKGVLHNAIVVVLSDHGEGLGLPSDNLLLSKEAKQIVGPLSVSMNGHGTSVLSPHQYSVVLAMRGYGSAPLGAMRRRISAPASLEDVAPTLLELVGIPTTEEEFDGVSWARLLQAKESESDDLKERIRFTETGYSPDSLLAGELVARELLTEAVELVRIVPETGRIVFREDRQDLIIATKERAALLGDIVLAALPSGESGQDRFFAVDRTGGLPRGIVGRPDPTSDPQLARLWDALHEHFHGELVVSDSIASGSAN